MYVLICREITQGEESVNIHTYVFDQAFKKYENACQEANRIRKIPAAECVILKKVSII